VVATICNWYYLLSFFKAWESMASITKSELLALIWKGTEVLRETSMNSVMIALFSKLKSICYVRLQVYILLLSIILRSSL